MNEDNTIRVHGKAGKSLPIPLSKKASRNLNDLQESYMRKYGKFINRKALGTKIFENATPEII